MLVYMSDYVNRVKIYPMANYIIKIDQQACIGCGTCVALAPKTFELDKNLKAKVKVEPHDPIPEIISAAQSCAVEAITVIDTKTNKKL